MLDFLTLAQQCAPTVAPQTMASVVTVESLANPYGIGVVDGYLVRQPANREEAVATAQALADAGWNFSLGIAQVNRYNLPKYNVTYDQAFDPCTSVRMGSKILEECYVRATKTHKDEQSALDAGLSCYYSGNFTRGKQADKPGSTSYVQRVRLAATDPIRSVPIVPPLIAGSQAKPIEVRATDSVKAPVVLTKEPSQPAKTVFSVADEESFLVRRQGTNVEPPEQPLIAPATAPNSAPQTANSAKPEQAPNVPVRLQSVTTEPSPQPEPAVSGASNAPNRSVVVF